MFFNVLKHKTGKIDRLRIEYFAAVRQIHENIGHKNGKNEDIKSKMRFLAIEILCKFVTELFHVELSHRRN